MSKLPNSLIESKGEYMQAVVRGRDYAYMNIAMFLYHAEVPLVDAIKYVDMYHNKTKIQRFKDSY